ncbi:MAG TPA: hypothetical protein VGS17_06660 [Candidatus Limnocylindria bacterium]|nr:hypothetical protein [Candidatus Limnocylindria bacterium]
MTPMQRTTVPRTRSSGRTARSISTTRRTKLSDLKAGDTITIAGTPDTTTGTLSAQTIVAGVSIFGDLFGGGAGSGARPSGSPRPSPTR